MLNIFGLLFGCLHSNLTFPITRKPGDRLNLAAQLTGTYVVCRNCGREFAYDWQAMKIVKAKKQRGLIPKGKSAA